MRALLVLFFCLVCSCAWSAVNLNSASQQELETLTGVGPSKAKAILAYRKQHGPFKSLQDLNNVPGFGDKTVKKLEKELTLSGPTETKSGK